MPPSPGTRAKQRWEGKEARPRDLERLCKSFQLRGDPLGTSFLHLGQSAQHVVHPCPGVSTGSATDPVFPLPCPRFQNSLREVRAFLSSFKHLFHFP